MARQPRIEYEGALHHVMSRGNDGIPVFRDDDDCEFFLGLVGEEVERSRWIVHDYSLMTNHFHLSIETPECTLSTGMHRLWCSRTFFVLARRQSQRDSDRGCGGATRDSRERDELKSVAPAALVLARAFQTWLGRSSAIIGAQARAIR